MLFRSHLSIYLVITYIAGVHLLKRWMRHRKAFELQPLLIIWNTALAVFFRYRGLAFWRRICLCDAQSNIPGFGLPLNFAYRTRGLLGALFCPLKGGRIRRHDSACIEEKALDLPALVSPLRCACLQLAFSHRVDGSRPLVHPTQLHGTFSYVYILRSHQCRLSST